jgi:hypothetical protein
MNILNKILYLLKDKAFWANLIVFFILMLISGWILLMSLKLITKWGQSADVPDILNKKFEVATEKIEEVGCHQAELSYTQRQRSASDYGRGSCCGLVQQH